MLFFLNFSSDGLDRDVVVSKRVLYMMLSNHSLFSSKKTPQAVRTPSEFSRAQDRARKLLSNEMEKETPLFPENDYQKTGWLPGPLSYPWIFIAIGISDLLHDFLTL